MEYGVVTGDEAADVTGAVTAVAGVVAAPAKFRFDAGANGLADAPVAALLEPVPRAAAALPTAAAFGSVAGAAVPAAPAVAGAAAVAGPAELNVLRPPGSIVDISFTPPKKLMLLCGLKGF